MTSLKRQIASLEAEGQVSQEPGSVHPASHSTLLAAARGTIEELQAQLGSAEVEIRNLDARVALTPARQETLAALQGRETVQRETYLEFLRKVQEAELAESLEVAQQGARFSLVDLATPPAGPMKARWKYAVLGLALSLAFAAGVGMALESFDPVLVRPDQVVAESGLPVLGTAPEIS